MKLSDLAAQHERWCEQQTALVAKAIRRLFTEFDAQRGRTMEHVRR